MNHRYDFLYLFDCTGKECVASRADGDPSGDESVSVANPAAGRWKVIVDHSSPSATAASFDYEDVVFNPAFGYGAVTDQPSERAIGATWSAQANAWFAEAIPASRSPFPAVLMQARPKGGEPFSIGMWELVGLGDRASQGREFR